MMHIQQFVMAYGIEQDSIRALLPDGFTSLRPVLRLNAEIADRKTGYLEFNTPVEKDGIRGWLNIGYWENIPFQQQDGTTVFQNGMIRLSFTPVGITGSCPAEKDNAGCFFPADEGFTLRPPEQITAGKEFCDCAFHWTFSPAGAQGQSIGKTLPAFPTPATHIYPRQPLHTFNAAVIPCQQVLGTYVVEFERI